MQQGRPQDLARGGAYSIGHLLGASQDNFRPSPPPQGLEKKWTIFLYIFEEYLLSLSYF